MGKTKQPTVAFKIRTEDFIYLVRALRDVMNQMIGSVDDDPYEQNLYEHNYYLIRSWIALCEAESQTITIKTDLLYAKAFVEYFKAVELKNNYEEMLLGKLIKDLHSGITNWEHKRRYAL